MGAGRPRHVCGCRVIQGSRASTSEFFRAFARRSSDLVGSSWAFGMAVGTVIVWAASGPLFHYSDTWQLIINTGTTIV
ncbi:MAG TPA: low affinity iron permease family protein, partial [Methylomirabilota bacterium]|nr:low affinity iron permease family protein [Methylomirabilota bacterium]